jgi:hypothetical protein
MNARIGGIFYSIYFQSGHSAIDLSGLCGADKRPIPNKSSLQKHLKSDIR